MGEEKGRRRGATGRSDPLLSSVAADVRAGLGRSPRTLPPKYFYDDRGSRLFEEITGLPEYYLTRTERSILERSAPAIMEAVRPEALVEFGSGSSGKTEILIREGLRIGSLRRYVAVDVSRETVRRAGDRLAGLYPDIAVEGLVADFHDEVEISPGSARHLVLFLGSTIGNLEPGAAVSFARNVRQHLDSDDAFLVGFDLVKDRARLLAAYDDARGVTAEFNRNALLVLNRLLDADFDPATFEHQAVWNEEKARIEMYLVSTAAQTVRVPASGMRLTFAPGDSICTELSHKYTRASAGQLLESAGYRVERWDADEEDLFAVALARPGEADAPAVRRPR